VVFISGNVALKAAANAPLPADGSRKLLGVMPFSFSVSESAFMASGGV
jgi:hypothetical protein